MRPCGVSNRPSTTWPCASLPRLSGQAAWSASGRRSRQNWSAPAMPFPRSSVSASSMPTGGSSIVRAGVSMPIWPIAPISGCSRTTARRAWCSPRSSPPGSPAARRWPRPAPSVLLTAVSSVLSVRRSTLPTSKRCSNRFVWASRGRWSSGAATCRRWSSAIPPPRTRSTAHSMAPIPSCATSRPASGAACSNSRRRPMVSSGSMAIACSKTIRSTSWPACPNRMSWLPGAGVSCLSPCSAACCSSAWWPLSSGCIARSAASTPWRRICCATTNASIPPSALRNSGVGRSNCRA